MTPTAALFCVAAFAGLFIPLVWAVVKVVDAEAEATVNGIIFDRQQEEIAALRRRHESLRKEFEAYASAPATDFAGTLRAVAAVLNAEADEYDPPPA